MAGDRYLRQRMLGEGGAGRVWLVEDTARPGRTLALKELTSPGAEAEAAFRREFATLASLHHPGLVEVEAFDARAPSGPPCFTLELIDGCTIEEAVRQEGPGVVTDLAVEALRALAFLHDFDLIHRDLKPANLLVRREPKLGCRLVIVDFGLARSTEALSQPGSSLGGTLPYLAPELFANRAASRRSDLYALGAVLHHVLYGAPPSSPERPTALPSTPPELPPGFDRWLAEMLSPEPERRPAGAPEALARLNEACGTQHAATTPVTQLARLLSGPPAGREASLAGIWAALEPSGGPRLVWLCGGPGTGKSRILRWLQAEAILRGWQPFATGDLAELRARARAGPTLLLLDEAHAADAATAHLLERVAREGAAPPVQVVAAVRPDAIERPALRELLAATGTVPTLRRVDLEPLDAEGVRAMACRATGGPVAEERVAWLLRACEGLPSLAESLLVEGAWERGGSPRRPPGAPEVPLARLDMVSGRARHWLTCAAVLRNEADEGDVAGLAGLDVETARAASEEAAAAGLASGRDGRWSVQSRALGEHLLSALPPRRRAQLHREAAERIRARQGADPWRLATLWAGAGDTEAAVAAAIAAAEASERAHDPVEAASRFGHALRLQRRGGRRERHALRVRQAGALLRAGMHAAAARACGAAVRLARDEAARTDALAMQALALCHAGRFALALAVARQAGERAAAAGDRRALALARRAAGIGLGRLGRESEAIPLLEEARRLCHEGGDVRAEAEVLQTLAACRARLGEAQAERDFMEAIALGGGEDLKAHLGLAVLLVRSGRYDEAVARLEQVRVAAAARGDLGLQEVALSKLAVAALDQGKLDVAIVVAGQAADLALHLADHNLILVNRCALADAWIRCGRAGKAVAALRESLQLPLSKVEPENVDYARMLLANAWMEAGGADEAHLGLLLGETLARCRERRKRRAWLMALVIEMERRSRGAGSDSFAAVETELEAVLAGSSDPVDPEIRVRAALARAAHHLRTADLESALARASEAEATARAHARPAFAARAAASRGAALERSGREAEAEEAFAEGRRLLDEAASAIEDRAVRADFLDRPVYALLRSRDSEDVRRSRGRLSTLYDMIRVLNSEPEPEELLERILDLALRAVSAERGMVLLREDREGEGQGQFAVHLSRNLEAETEHDARAYSRRIVEAASEGRSLLALDAGEDARFRDLASVSLYRIRSLMCVPLRSRGRILGTVYLDSRKEGRLFTQDDLRFVEAFADQAALAIENARMRARLTRQNRQLLAAVEARASFGSLVGRSSGMQALYSLVEKIAATDLPVLIRGESGTGKELVARAIHAHGRRRRRPFLGENCAAIPEALLESELFGHVRGAYTGADRERPGLFEQASGGTLFLDEVGDMPAPMQARLLRVLEEGKVRRVGSERTTDVDVRVVAATHRDLSREIESGRFRQDLMYRLQVLTVEIPPLRARAGDVPLLTAHFLERIAAERGGRDPWLVDDEAMALLERHSWPGNVRELQNTLQRLSLLAGSRAITRALIESDPTLRRTLLPEGPAGSPAYSLKAGEREQVRQALAAAKGNRKRAAALLGVSRATLYRKLEHHKL